MIFVAKKYQALILFYGLCAFFIMFMFVYIYNSISSIHQLYEMKIELTKNIYKTADCPMADFEKSTTLEIANKKKQNSYLILLLQVLLFAGILIKGIQIVRRNMIVEQKLNKQQKNFMLSITHELKSPLAGIKLSLDTISLRQLEEPAKKRLMNNAFKDIERLNILINNILMSARIDEKDMSFAYENINFSEVAEDTISTLQDNYSSVRSFIYNIEPNVQIQADKNALNSILNNLLENAIKYTPVGSKIELSVRSNGEQATLIIADNGVGVPDEQKSKVFEKFYRLGNENTRSAKGTGLGLYLVKQLIEMHGGKIALSDNEPTGAVFTATLPLKFSGNYTAMV